MSSTGYELIQSTLSGERPERIPLGLWTHLPEVDQDPQRLAQATYQFYRDFDLDFVKTMDSGLYSVEDFGVLPDYSAIATGGTATPHYTPFSSVGDLVRLAPVDVSNGAYGRQLESLRELLSLLDGAAPVVVTVFSPLTSVNKLLAGKLGGLLAGEDDDAPLRHALDVFTEVTTRFVQQAIGLGASGVFYASQVSTTGVVGADAHTQYAEPYDLAVLESAREGWFNILHLHGDDLLFDIASRYPAQAVSWHIGETAPQASHGIAASGKAAVGGIKQSDIPSGDRAALRRSLGDLIEQTGGIQTIVGPGCTIPHPFENSSLAAVRTILDEAYSSLATVG
jgi:uroporphyrinogen decarboxylase